MEFNYDKPSSTSPDFGVPYFQNPHIESNPIMTWARAKYLWLEIELRTSLGFRGSIYRTPPRKTIFINFRSSTPTHLACMILCTVDVSDWTVTMHGFSGRPVIIVIQSQNKMRSTIFQRSTVSWVSSDCREHQRLSTLFMKRLRQWLSSHPLPSFSPLQPQRRMNGIPSGPLGGWMSYKVALGQLGFQVLTWKLRLKPYLRNFSGRLENSASTAIFLGVLDGFWRVLSLLGWRTWSWSQLSMSTGRIQPEPPRKMGRVQRF